MMSPGDPKHPGRNPEVIAVGQAAYRTAYDQAIVDGKTADEADVAGKDASLEARKAKIAELMAP